ncbi:sugar ABC transporter permease [Paenibacillus antri]|uniref:Sugar ABC transporter permease n=1 Tax=Paenibacillus antri TaxID=2582848 RepID=A0A5R9GGT8_9BACL|nr:sugar ABC transporter permease [Paenibacillus antri]TLS50625.1 sugar ABC transporter permease [Paenibacillus antri]
MSKRRSDAIWGFVFILPQFAGMLLFSLLPLVFVFVLSTMKWDGFGARQFIGLDNFAYMLTDTDLGIALKNTLWYSVLTVPSQIVIGLLVALALNRVAGKTFYRVVYFMPTVTGTVAVAIVFMWLLNPDFGIVNTYIKQLFGVAGPRWLTDPNYVIPSISLLSVWLGIGFNMVIFLAGLQGISRSYFEAAEIDGASRLQQFRSITLPLLSPTTFFVTIIAIINSFKVFDQILVMTGGGPGNASRVLVFHLYDYAFQDFSFGRSSASAVLMFLIILVLTLIQMRISRRWVHYEG